MSLVLLPCPQLVSITQTNPLSSCETIASQRYLLFYSDPDPEPNLGPCFEDCTATPQLVSITTLGSTSGKGGFYPAGFKGAITGSPGSAASAANLPGGASGGVPATAPTSGARAHEGTRKTLLTP